MNAETEIAKRHLEALLGEMARAEVPADVVGRLLLQHAVEIWKAERSLSDIREELAFVAESLDPDTDFEFMRP